MLSSQVTHTDDANERERTVAVVGGGITGLSAAWALQQAGVGYTLIEANDRWGGKIRTDTVDGSFVIEGGPDSFITQKPWALELIEEMGLSDRVLDTNDDRRGVFVLNKGRPTPLPEGVMMIVPTKIMPFALSPLISLPGKIRMGFDLFLPAKLDGKDETIEDFIVRRLGHEALDKLAEPLMSGIYNAEAERQSLLATFPRFRRLEEKYGSLTMGMLASRKRRQNAKPKRAFFVSMKGGSEELVGSIVERLTGDLRLSTAVERIEQAEGVTTLYLSDGTTVQADAVILAVPAFVAAKLLADLSPEAAAVLDQIRYVSTGTLSLAFRRDEVDHDLDGFGMVIPRSENRCINAITWTSTKFDHRAPEDHALLRVFFGGSRRPEMMEKSDEELLAIVREELRDTMGIDAEPVLHRIYRWFDSNPQYDVDHLERVTMIEEALPRGIHVTGSPYRGIGIPDCVKQGRATAEEAAARIRA